MKQERQSQTVAMIRMMVAVMEVATTIMPLRHHALSLGIVQSYVKSENKKKY